MLRALEETVETIAAIMTNPARDRSRSVPRHGKAGQRAVPPEAIQERHARNDNALARRASARHAGQPAGAAA
ncbi:hypothetical protein [Burkholderia plantarii]|uniref:hypothetical protein n=1 Tax=Burkholderia plantarii TaxID=41899 RepID=UPI000A811C6B|nr:hypothetical protein [Burkholderia plantarii]WLE60458.1 hypothetical protein GIY62_07350 [Burkholderia plantarii]